MLIEDIKTKEEQLKTKEANDLRLEKDKIDLEKIRKDKRLEKYLSGKEWAEKTLQPGFEIDEEMEKYALEKDQQQSAAADEALQQQQQEAEKQQALEQAQIQQQAQIEKQAMHKEQAVAIAQEEMHKQKIQNTAQKLQSIHDKIEKEDTELRQIDPERFWNNASTGRKVMAGIGMLLSGIGSGLTGQKNMAMETINRLIDNDIKAQQLNAEQGLAKKKMSLEQIKLNMQKLNDATSNRLKQAQTSKIIADINNDIAKLQEQRINAKKLASSEGLTREEVFAMPTEERKLMVKLSDGNFRPAMNEQLAKKLNGETIPQAKDAIRGLERLKEMTTMPFSEFNLYARGEAESIKQSIKGALRLKLFGPGVMTDFESKLADRIIGSPTGVLKIKSVEMVKLNTLLKKMKQGTLDEIRQAGVNVPKTKNEKMLDQYMHVMEQRRSKSKSKSKPISRPEAINALIHLGKWDENEDIGF